MRTFLTLFLLCVLVGCSSNDEVLFSDPESDGNQSSVTPEHVKNKKEKTVEIQDDEIHDGMKNEADETRENIGFINNEDLMLNDLYLEMAYSDFSKIMGSELEKTAEYDLGDDGVIYKLTYVDGTIVYLLNDVIFSIEVTSTNYITPRGLKVGDSKEEVVKLYKNPFHLYNDNWGYTNTNVEYIRFTLEFVENRVSKIGITQII